MNDILSNNIFNDVKRNLPISEEDNSFDDEILTYINSIFFDFKKSKTSLFVLFTSFASS